MNPTNLFVSLAGSALVLSATLHAEAVQSPSGRYDLKNRSNFRIDTDARAPFWPIGWKKPKTTSAGTTTTVTETSGIKLEAGNFTLTSILLGNPPLATINGHSFEEGELLPVICGKERLRVVVRAIRDGAVWLEHDGQQIMVPLHRPELGPKRSEQKAQAQEFVIKIAPK